MTKLRPDNTCHYDKQETDQLYGITSAKFDIMRQNNDFRGRPPMAPGRRPEPGQAPTAIL